MNIINVKSEALGTADTVGSVDKERKKIERQINAYADRALGLRAPTVADARAAERDGVDVETYCRRKCEALIARCESHRSATVSLADAAE